VQNLGKALLGWLVIIVIGVVLWRVIFPAPHRAAKSGDVETLKGLLDGNPDLVNKTNFLGATALHYAAREGQAKAAALLLARGADVNARDHSGQTALHWAATAGQEDVAEVLIASGADVNLKSSLSGWTPLHLAAKLGRTNFAALLLSHGADVGIKDKSGAAPAAYASNEDLSRLLTPHP
jgi:ankyrin repeat protein